MPLSIAERLHRLPHGAQLEVADVCGVHKSTVSQIARGEYQGGNKTDASKKLVREVQLALAAKLGLPVEDAFAEWEPPQIADQEAPPIAAAS